MHRSIAVPALALLIVTAGYAQSPAPPTETFEVASIKANRSGAPFRMGPVLQPAGRVVATNVTLHDLVRAAFSIDAHQVVGAPGWFDEEQFDVEARGPADLTREQAQAMLRDLLADRFKLATHPETRQLPIYRLVIARRDRGPGPQLRTSGRDCTAPTAPPGMQQPPPPPPPPPGMSGVSLRTTPDVSRRCVTARFPNGLSARAVTMAAFANLLFGSVGRLVIDDTRLTGEFDLDLHYSPDLWAGPSAIAPPVTSGPSLFTALEEQLGLKLEASRGPVHVVVIDRAERPADN